MTLRSQPTQRGEPVRVLVVDDSATTRVRLEAALRQDPRFEVVGLVGDGREAVEALRRLRPDVVSMDVRLPGQTGLEACQEIMQEQPTPIVVLTGVTGDDALPFEALRAGAMALHGKGLVFQDDAGMADYLDHLHRYSQVVAIRLRRPRATITPPTRKLPTPAATAPPTPLSTPPRPPPSLPPRRSRPPPPPEATAPRVAALGIVASTGGPAVLHELLAHLPGDLAGPVLVTVHIQPNFVGRLASWLGRAGPLPVEEAREGATARDGVVYLAPADEALTIDRDFRLGFRGGYQPLELGDAMLRSLAEALGARAAGLVLSGMGHDGAAGLGEIRARGGSTAVQDPESAVIGSMPSSARVHALEALPVAELATWVRRLFPPRA